VHPREHVARVPERVVCVELDRPDGRAARREQRPAERVGERGRERGRARLCEECERLAA
jgi:hypothetical protein